LQTSSKQQIPEAGWWDAAHMNAIGAEIFSKWLGEQVGKAVRKGTIALPSR
jgi:hypothetical protein